MSEEKAVLTNVKFLRQVDYKGAGFAKGVIADLEPHVAERLIADGHAEAVEEKAASKKAEK
jgi:hypothetical protein